MKPNPKQQKRQDLFDKACDGLLSEAESRELEDILKNDEEARRQLAGLLACNALLRREKSTLGKLEQSNGEDTSSTTPFPKTRTLLGYAASAACAAILVSLIWASSIRNKEASPATAPITPMEPDVATLTRTVQCKWAGSEVPTVEGSRITAGQLHLLEGLATVTFDSGAELIMEAPASVTIIDAMNCRLQHGTVVADVPEQAKGFTVVTDETTVVDFGTRFGISASRDGKSVVNVLQGVVEVEHHKTKETKRLTTGGRIDFGGWTDARIPQPGSTSDNDLREPPRWNPLIVENAREGWHLLSTAFGNGRDTYVRSDPKFGPFGGESFFRVKYTSHNQSLIRKGYVAFDLSAFRRQEIEDAQFILHLEPTDLGFASLVPDSTFTIYGLVDGPDDSWKEDELNWKNAPGHLDDPVQHLATDRLVKLGTMTVEQGVQNGSRLIQGHALVDFLNQDTNGEVTLVLVRETDEQDNGGLVHSFATKEHPSNTPPLLRLKVK